MWKSAITELVQTNIGWLRQAQSLLLGIDDSVFASSPKGLTPHKAGSHLRHVLEFYECFLDGLPGGPVDYDNRRRDESVEKNRHAAAARIRSIIERLEEVRSLSPDLPLSVRMENADFAEYLRSSVGRELQALSGHTIHHFALMSMTLRIHGVAVDPDFGMSPSTLRFHATKVLVPSALIPTQEAA